MHKMCPPVFCQISIGGQNILLHKSFLVKKKGAIFLSPLGKDHKWKKKGIQKADLCIWRT